MYQRELITAQFEIVANELGKLRDLVYQDQLEGDPEVTPQPQRLRFDAPVGSQSERDAAQLWPGDWFDASPYGEVYQSSVGQAIHTGADLNRPGYKDVGQLVFAAADGIVDFVGKVQSWQGVLVVIVHLLETGEEVWTRYAHLQGLRVVKDQPVKRGDILGAITDYTPAGPSGDHLHYDIARIDLGAKPGDWPGMDKARVDAGYYDPLKFTKARHP